MGVAAIFLHETFCDHGCNNCFSSTYHIGKEEAIVFLEHLKPLYYSIALVFERHVAFWHFKRKVIFNLVAESVDQYFDENLVWRL